MDTIVNMILNTYAFCPLCIETHYCLVQQVKFLY